MVSARCLLRVSGSKRAITPVTKAMILKATLGAQYTIFACKIHSFYYKTLILRMRLTI
jgi:hypothetical protein